MSELINSLTHVRDFLFESVSSLQDDVLDVLDDVWGKKKASGLKVSKIGSIVVVSSFSARSEAITTADEIMTELDGVRAEVDPAKGGFVVKVTDESEVDEAIENGELDEDDLEEGNPFHSPMGRFSAQSNATSFSWDGEQAYFKSGKKVAMKEPGGRLARRQGKDNPIKANTDKALGAKGLRGHSSKKLHGSQVATGGSGDIRNGKVRYGGGSDSALQKELGRGMQSTANKVSGRMRDRSYAELSKEKEDKSAKQYNQRLSASRKGGETMKARAAARRAAKAESVEDEFSGYDI